MSASQDDPKRIRELLIRRRAVLADRHERVQRDLGRVNEPLVADSSDRAIQLENDEVLEGIDRAAAVEVAEIDAALARLDQGQYGICDACGESIAPARLEALPQAMLCAQCADSRIRSGN